MGGGRPDLDLPNQQLVGEPSNVMVTDEGRVKVLDFGLAHYSRFDLAGDLYLAAPAEESSE